MREDDRPLMYELDALGQDRTGLAGERLAKRAHMSQAKISRIETGRLLPTITEVERILKALDVPADRARSLDVPGEGRNALTGDDCRDLLREIADDFRAEAP